VVGLAVVVDMSKTEQLRKEIKDIENKLREKKEELHKHISRTTYFTCPRCMKKSRIGSLDYGEVYESAKYLDPYEMSHMNYTKSIIFCAKCNGEIPLIPYYDRKEEHDKWKELRFFFRSIKRIEKE